MSKPRLHGPAFSTYVRTCRLVLAEKGVDYDMNEFNFLEGWPDGYDALHPFRKVPAFEHGDVKLFETLAIAIYVDSAFEGPSLIPAAAADRARCIQVCNVNDNYAYPALITRTFIPRAVVPMLGGTTDEAKVEKARPDAERALGVLEGLLGSNDYFTGAQPALSDFHLLPVLHYTSQIPDGQAMLAKNLNLSAWLDRMNRRDSVKETIPAL